MKEEPRNFLERGGKGKGTWASARGRESRSVLGQRLLSRICRLERRGP